MASGVIAAFVAVLTMSFVELLARFYPARRTWLRLRRVRGRLAVRLMRERYEEMSKHPAPKVLAEILLGLVIVWIAVSPLLDKRWYEVLTDVGPYAFVAVALLRTPYALRKIAERMKGYERDAGEDPDADIWDSGDGGPTAIAL
ncbi:MAG TPA: hypothetical protein VFK89_00360 [Actinomycetota bacterium]|nr:hypothetical protein [Actinomycetota bacterium]